MILVCGLSGLAILLLVVTFVSYKMSQVFRFYCSYFMYNCAIVVLALLATFVGILRPGNVDNFYRTSRLLYWIATKTFKIKVETKGMENLPDPNKVKKNFVIVSNHQSSLDMFPLLYLCPHYTTFIAKKQILFAPFFGVAAWLSGVVFVSRGNSKSARGVMDGAVRRISSEQMNLWVFPEGTRSQTGTMKPFKKGAFHVAQQAQIPIVPLVISNYISIFNKKNKTFEAGTIKVTILPPVSTEGLTPDDVGSLTERVRQQMLEVFHEGKPILPLESDATLKEKAQ